jgi:UDP-N-acetylglucosamine pyrophosphorylase
MCNLFNIDALTKLSTKKLPYHIAFKKYNYMDKDCNLVVSEKPNAYKFESFIFDSFEYFNDISVLRGKREEDFAPIKNKEGVDSPQTAVELYNNYMNKNN